MAKRKKTFDCVEMKDRIQQKLREEYESRKSEFDSYADFINATDNKRGIMMAGINFTTANSHREGLKNGS